MTLIAPPEAPSTTAPAVEARGVHVRLGASHILRGVDLTVARGEVVALLGANGSGKSTLVRTLVGVLPASEGDVRLLGSPLRPPRGSRGAARQGRERVAWDKIGYVPQRVSAGGGIPSTAQEVVASGLLHAHRLRLPRGWRAEVRSALDQVGLGDRAHDPTSELSGGQQQRVLIARALVRKPELLVLDEPVAGVDRPSQEAFAATMSGLVADGLTVLVVLHELGELAPLVSRCVVLRHGRVVHDGAPPRPHGAHDAVGHDHVHPHEPASAGAAPGLSDGPFPGSEARS